MATDIPKTDLRPVDDALLDAKGITSPVAREWLKGKTAQDFEVLEHLGRIYWPIKIQRMKRGTDKRPTWSEEPALLRVLDTRDKARAVRDATHYFDAQGFDIKDTRHQAIWTEIETHAIVAVALREAVDARTSKPYGDDQEPHPKASLEDLLNHAVSGISASEVTRLYDLTQTFDGFEGAKLERVDRELAIRIALTCVEAGNISPLGVISGQGVDSCVLYLMQILSAYLRQEPSGASPESSTQAP